MLQPGRIALARFLRLLLVLSFFGGRGLEAEIIYDNTASFLNRFFNEKREYGDQVDFGGTARRLTQILFEYYGEFEPDADEMAKVRIYANETPYDNFRKSPTTLLFESGWLPIVPGYHTLSIGGLNLQLPPHTATITVEFAGLEEGESAGLLFYGPPTVGYSFNEIWLRGATGRWAPVSYSRTDPTQRASVSMRLIAEPEVLLDQRQTNFMASVPLRDGTNRVRLAQTFRPEISGRLSQVALSMQFTNEPVLVRILDALGQAPGPNVLGELFLLEGTGARQTLHFIDQEIYLEAGTSYAIELSTKAGVSEAPSHLAPVSRNNYGRGDLWARNEAGGAWAALTENHDGRTFLDAVFETYLIPAEPDVELMRPRRNQQFDLAEPIELRATHRPAEIGVIAHVRYMDGNQEIGRATSPPYTFTWTNATPGEHILRAIAEDSFRRPFRSERVWIDVRPAGAPGNDSFAGRKELTGSSARGIKPTASATIEAGEPNFYSPMTGATLWWTWTAYDDSPVTISAQNSSDSAARVAVFTGDSLETLAPVTNGVTRIQFQPKAGVAYAIVADPKTRGDLVTLDIAVADVRLPRVSPSFPRATEPVELALTRSSTRNITNVTLLAGGQPLTNFSVAFPVVTGSFPTSGDFEVAVAATDDRGIQTISSPIRITVRPENDAFRHAKALTGLSGEVPFSSLAAAAELIDPIWFGEESHSIWYRWEAPGPGHFAIETPNRGMGAGFGAYTARTNGALVLLDAVAAMSPSNRFAFEASAGQVYYFFVAGAGPEQASLEFEFRPLRIDQLAIANGTVSIRFATVLNQRIYVETSTNLVTWERAGELILGTGEDVAWTDSADGEPARFYRIARE